MCLGLSGQHTTKATQHPSAFLIPAAPLPHVPALFKARSTPINHIDTAFLQAKTPINQILFYMAFYP